MIRWIRKIGLSFVALAAVSPIFASSGYLAHEDPVPNLRWRPGAIRLAVSASLLRESSNIKRESDVAGALRRSIETWSNVANVEFVIVNSEKLSASPAGVAGDGVNLITVAQTPENVLLFAKDPENAAATTRVFYNRRGAITEADIVLNPYQQFSTDGTLGTFDLESTLTHEIGHLLGLAHSAVLGSTMHANYGKNGVFGLQNFASRTLSSSDIAAVRAVYGAPEDAADCCGEIEGRLVNPLRAVRNSVIWLEDTSGRVRAGVDSTNGEFRFSGLRAGKYRIFAMETARTRGAAAVHQVAEATVAAGEVTSVSARLNAGTRDFELNYLGLNGQLSEMAVSVSAGRTYVIYLGGQNLDPKRLSVSFSSPNLTFVPGTLRAHDYGSEVSVVSLEVRVAPSTPKGEYTIFVESDRGDRRAILGGLTVDSFTNPWSGVAIFE